MRSQAPNTKSFAVLIRNRGKYAGIFVSTGTPGGGQESTAIAAASTLAHHGIIYVPLGYKTAFSQLANLTEVRGGSPWGAGTFAVRSHFYPKLQWIE